MAREQNLTQTRKALPTSADTVEPEFEPYHDSTSVIDATRINNWSRFLGASHKQNPQNMMEVPLTLLCHVTTSSSSHC